MTMKRILSFAVAFVVAMAMVVPTVLTDTKAATKNVTLTVAGQDTYYDSVAEAVAVVPKDNTEAVITLNNDYKGPGVKVQDGQYVTFDLNGYTWDITDTVGSAGTETNGMQLLKDSKVTIMNGTMTSATSKLLIQNYCELTLNDVKLSGADNLTQLIVSNNNGKTLITGKTEIKAAVGGNAMDADFWSDNVYTGGNVVLESGTITGDVVATNGGKMFLNGGTIYGDVRAENYGANKYSEFSGTITMDGVAVNGNVIAESKGKIIIQNADVTGKVSSNGENKVAVTGGTFYTELDDTVDVQSDMKAVITSGGITKTVVGKEDVQEAISQLEAGDHIRFDAVAESEEISIPEGVTIKNNTGADMTINGVTVAAGAEVIVKDNSGTDGNGDSNQGDKPSPSEPDKAEGTPKTGDDTMLLGYVILMLAALGIGGTLVVNRKKN